MFKKGLEFTKWHKDLEFVITELEWERIFLKAKVKTNYSGGIQFALVQKYTQVENEKKDEEFAGLEIFLPKVQISDRIDIEHELVGDGMYSLEIDIANVDAGNFLENGQWSIAVFIDDGVTFVNVDNDVAYSLQNMDKVYKYGIDKYAYNVTFEAKNIEDLRLELIINSYFLKLNNKWKKRHYVEEAHGASAKLKRARYAFIISCMNLTYKVCKFLRNTFCKNSKRILFMSETKDRITGNLEGDSTKSLRYRIHLERPFQTSKALSVG